MSFNAVNSRLSDSDSEDEDGNLQPVEQLHNEAEIESNDEVEDLEQESFSIESNLMATMTQNRVPLAGGIGFTSATNTDSEDSEPEERPPRSIKRPRPTDHEAAPQPNKAQKMMALMGYKAGAGLGKQEQGRKEPVALSTQRGRRGLGLRIPGLEAASKQWDPTLEDIKVQEDMEWLENKHSSLPTMSELASWLGLEPKKSTIDNETTFCDEDVLKDVLCSKSVFDKLDGNELRKARTRCNPFETIGGVFFLNRAAVKMANIDKACNFCFTKPEGLASDELLYFSDVCAGPGGFSEYVLWRKKWNAKGFGFTLRGQNDFKLDEFYAGPCETFHPFYGPKDNGDVYDPENQRAFYQLVMEETREKKLHFMMSDGGFCVEGQENIQEILSKQLYLCQCLVALMTVRDGGHFVTKVFDLFTQFSAGLVYLMYRCFDKICIFKPNTSRPANSERYLICIGKRPGISDIINHLSRVNKILLSSSKSADESEVSKLVSLDELKDEERFKKYLTESNNSLGKKQVVGLVKIAAFCHDTNLTEPTQADMRRDCLAYWELPSKPRTAPKLSSPRERLPNLTKNRSLTFMSSPYTVLTTKNIGGNLLTSPYDWFCMPSVSGEESDKQAATFYMGLGRTNVFRYEKNNWIREQIPLELPADTLVYAEMANELRGEFRSQLKTHALHILDAYFLGGEDVSHLHLTERSAKTRKFCEALRKPKGQQFAQIRAKNLYEIADEGWEKRLRPCLKLRTMKTGNQATVFVPLPNTNLRENNSNEEYYFVTNGILFLKGTADPFSRHLSRSTGYKYYFDSTSGDRRFDQDRPDKAVAKFCESFRKRVMFFWSSDLSKDDLSERIKMKCSS